MSERRFHVIDGTPAPDTPKERTRKRLKAEDPRPPSLLACPRCTGRELIETTTGVTVRRGGKPSGGTKQLLCAQCLLRGERVVIW